MQKFQKVVFDVQAEMSLIKFLKTTVPSEPLEDNLGDLQQIWRQSCSSAREFVGHS